MNPFIRSSSYVILSAALLACGGGGGGGSLASGGISGSGSGTVTGIGSIFLNDDSRYDTSNATVIIDDNPGSESDIKLGMVIQADLSNLSDDNPSLRTGDADRVVISHEIKGPVTSTSPLEVLGQQIVVTGDTFIQDSGQNGQDDTQTINIATLSVGDEVEVSGHRDDQGVIQASRIEKKLTGLNEWKLTGTVAGLSGSSFNISGEPIDFGSLIPQDCGAGLNDGDRVEVKATAHDRFNPTLNSTYVTEVECKPNTLTFGGTINGTIEGEFEGFVTSIGVNSFSLGEQPVTWGASTLFEGGTELDLAVGVKLDVRGDFDGTTLVADRIRFRHARFRIIAPSTLLSATNVETLGLTINITAQTEVDTDAVVNNQVRVRGFIDSSGALFADEVEDRGTADNTVVRLRGPVDDGSIDTIGQDFEILGITILGATASEYKIEDVTVNDTQFFNALTDNSEVDVDQGSYDSFTDTISNAKLEIEIED